MTQETTLTIQRFIEFVGVWMGKNGVVVPVDLHLDSELEWFCRVGDGRSLLIVVAWDKKGVCSEIWASHETFPPTEAGLLDALTELAERLRGEK